MPSAGKGARGGRLKKDAVGAERGESRTALEMVSIVSPFQGGADVDDF